MRWSGYVFALCHSAEEATLLPKKLATDRKGAVADKRRFTCWQSKEGQRRTSHPSHLHVGCSGDACSPGQEAKWASSSRDLFLGNQ
jgi:hypothetical protein